MITIDITTRNTIFNPLSAQGSWIQHRFGRRNYPLLDLDIETILAVFDQHKQVFVRCVFGDPLCHPNIENILELAQDKSVNLILFTYLNISDTALINKLRKYNVSVFVPVDGFFTYGKTLLDSCGRTVYENLQLLAEKSTVEFHLYSYNISETDLVKQFCDEYNCNLKFQAGKNFGLPVTSVINETGNWLYDVLPLNSVDDKVSDNRLLDKTVEGYRSLLDYTKPVEGTSILDKPAISKRLQTDEKFSIDMPAVSATGHVFESAEEMFTFSNALCTDWQIDSDKLLKLGREGHILDHYAILVGSTLNRILDSGFKRFCDSNV